MGKIDHVSGGNLSQVEKSPAPPAAPRPAETPVAGPPAPKRGSDTVQISNAGRELARAEADPKQRLAELRLWINSDASDAPQVLDDVARQILDSGDL